METSTVRRTVVMGLMVLCSVPAFAQVVVTNDITTNTTWSSSNEYVLDGLIFVHAGATLTIEPGTIIKGLEEVNITTGDGASALIVRRGAKLMAVGTSSLPIVFTSELDDLNDPADLDQQDRGLWGGVILLGYATTNQATTENQIEGIASEPALYGGNDDADDSGTLKYVSIRHGGFSISGVPGDEINGLTLGGVGSGTTIEHVEVFANLDDCYEWFGGTVRTKWLVGAFCADDTFDYDQGFRGKGQFWFSIQSSDEAGRAGEHDGGDAGGDDATPFSIPLISNVTYIGSGVGSTPGGDNNDRTFAIRDNAGGKYYNSIFTDFPNVAMDIEDLVSGADSRERLETGDLLFSNNMFFKYGAGSTFADIVPDFAVSSIAATNSIEDPMLGGICRTTTQCLDPRPDAGSPALSGAVDTGDGWFESVPYLGAFGTVNWADGWTALATNGYLGQISSVAVETLIGEAPSSFSLNQNYPNPFNPTTTIKFSLKRSQQVRLSVFDTIGREVAVLVDATKPAGVYQIMFDASQLSSGVYLYRLQSESQMVSKTLTLLK